MTASSATTLRFPSGPRRPSSSTCCPRIGGRCQRSCGREVFGQDEAGLECRIRRADGEIRWIWTIGKRWRHPAGGWRIAGVVQDITDRKNSEEALRTSEERLKKAFVSIPDSFAMNTFPDGEMIAVNRGFETIFGHSEAGGARKDLARSGYVGGPLPTGQDGGGPAGGGRHPQLRTHGASEGRDCLPGAHVGGDRRARGRRSNGGHHQGHHLAQGGRAPVGGEPAAGAGIGDGGYQGAQFHHGDARPVHRRPPEARGGTLHGHRGASRHAGRTEASSSRPPLCCTTSARYRCPSRSWPVPALSAPVQTRLVEGHVQAGYEILSGMAGPVACGPDRAATSRTPRWQRLPHGPQRRRYRAGGPDPRRGRHG